MADRLLTMEQVAERRGGIRLMTDKHAAEHWGVPLDVVRYACRHRMIDHICIGKRLYRFKPEQAEAVCGDDLLKRVRAAQENPVLTKVRKAVGSLRVNDRHIYFAQAGEAVKIGTAVNPEARLAMLQTGNPEKIELLGTIAGNVLVEKAIHRELANYRLQGEWFRASRPVMRFVKPKSRPGQKPRYLPKLFDISGLCHAQRPQWARTKAVRVVTRVVTVCSAARAVMMEGEMRYVWRTHEKERRIRMHIMSHSRTGEMRMASLCNSPLPFNRSINAPFKLGRPVCKHCLRIASEDRT